MLGQVDGTKKSGWYVDVTSLALAQAELQLYSWSGSRSHGSGLCGDTVRNDKVGPHSAFAMADAEYLYAEPSS